MRSKETPSYTEKGFQKVEELFDFYQQLDRLLEGVSSEAREVIELRTGARNGRPKSWEEIGRLMGISKSTAVSRATLAIRNSKSPHLVRRMMYRFGVFNEKGT